MVITQRGPWNRNKPLAAVLGQRLLTLTVKQQRMPKLEQRINVELCIQIGYPARTALPGWEPVSDRAAESQD